MQVLNHLIKKTPLTKRRLEVLHELCLSAPVGCFVECGVYLGWSACIMINAADRKRPIFLCDSYEGFPEFTQEDILPHDLDLKGPAKLATVSRCKESLVRRGICLEGVTFVKGFFKDTLPKLAKEINNIAVLHIDADLYKSTQDVLKYLLPKVAKKGYVIIHDYPGFAPVKKAVEEFVEPKDLIVINDETVYFVKK